MAIRDTALLVSLGWSYPTAQFAAGLVSGSYQRDLLACCAELAAPPGVIAPLQRLARLARTAADPEAVLSELRTAHTSVLDMPGKPYASLYESQFHASNNAPRKAPPGDRGRAGRDRDAATPLFIGPAAAQVKELFDAGGVAVPLHEPPDHVAREWEFVALCATRQLDAQEGEKERWAQLRRQMGTAHLYVWVKDWSDRVKEACDSPFYRELAEFSGALSDSQLLWKDVKPSALHRVLPIFPRRRS